MSSNEGTFEDAIACLLTLRRRATALRVLDSAPKHQLRALYRSMTPAEREDAIGALRLMKDHVGILYVRFSRIEQSLKLSKTASST